MILLRGSGDGRESPVQREDGRLGLGLGSATKSKTAARFAYRMPGLSGRTGCDARASFRAFFSPGHDKTAESAVVKCEYGTVPDLLVAHGYGPGGKNPQAELQRFQRSGGEYL